MAKESPQGFRLLILGAFGIVLAMLTCGFLLFFVLRASASVADSLPSIETVAVFHGLDTTERQRVIRTYPILSSFPALPTDRPADVAFLTLPDGSVGWAMVTEETQPDSGWKRFITGRTFSVTSSSPAIEAILKKKEPPLSAKAEFRELTSATGSGSWAFVRLDLLNPTPQSSDASVLRKQLASPFVLFSWSPASLRVAALVSGNGVRSSLAPLRLSPPADTVVSFTSPLPTYDAILHTMPAMQQAIVEGLARAWWAKLFGSHTSFSEDFPALLAHPISFEEKSGTGSSPDRFLLETDDSGDMSSLLNRLHASVRASFHPFVLEKRALTRGFTSTTIQEAPTDAHDRTDTRNEWNMRTTKDAGSAAIFLSARKPGHVLIGNDATWMQQAMDLTATRESGQAEQGFTSVADERISREALQTLIGSDGGLTPALRLLDAFGPKGDTLSLSASEKGNVLVLTTEAAMTSPKVENSGNAE